VRAAVERGEAARDAGDWVAVGTADLDFHVAVAGLTGSERVGEAMRRLLAELRLAFGAMPSAEDLHAPFLRRNRILLGLLADGLISEAEAELASYLDDACQSIVAVIEQAAADGSGADEPSGPPDHDETKTETKTQSPPRARTQVQVAG
ncbi:MAG: FCD domain-containing protein, partial [Streptomycetaceae bacterium]|nr:FCD domain-containing protein [Streptomycetaceae bacterium]